MAAVIEHLDGLDIELCRRINRLARTEGVRQYFRLVSKLGDGGFWIAMAFVLISIQGTPALPTIARMALAAAIGIVVYKILKQNLARERPYIAHGDIQLGAPPLDRYSFPSGHTLHAVSFTIMLGNAEPVLLFLALPFAVLVASSRVILGLHYPSDVLVGAMLGAALAAASVTLE
jgi:undecaprenyl-diphosphatase